MKTNGKERKVLSNHMGLLPLTRIRFYEVRENFYFYSVRKRQKNELVN